MLDKSKLTRVDISIDLCGCHLQSLCILSSGLLRYGAEGMIKGHEAGVGAVVTKTIRLGAATNPMYRTDIVNQDSLINYERWVGSSRLSWHESRIPKTVAAGAVIIGSVSHTLKEAQAIIGDVEYIGAHMIELVSYTGDTLIPMLDYTRAYVDIPVIYRLSGNWPDTVGATRKCLECGANGICVINSIGLMLKVDIEKTAPETVSGDGFGWMIGAATRPITMRYNYQIAKKNPQLMNPYTSGGVMKADDAIEYMMTGTTGIGVCTVGIPKGAEYVEKMCYDLSGRLTELGYDSIREVNRAVYPDSPSGEYVSGLKFHFIPFKENDAIKKYVSYKKCGTVCCYDAREFTFPGIIVDMDRCRCCGLYPGVRPVGALVAGLAPQTEKSLTLAQKSRGLYESVKQQTLMAAALPDPVRESIRIQKGRKRNVNVKREKGGRIPGPHNQDDSGSQLQWTGEPGSGRHEEIS